MILREKFRAEGRKRLCLPESDFAEGGNTEQRPRHHQGLFKETT
jgi:hypothetical protein